jgi:AraC family transcriptional regulator
MEPRIEVIAEKKLVGKRLTMSLAKDRTSELWRTFMARRKEVQNTTGTALYSMHVYSPRHFDVFDPSKEFEKWAAVEVIDFGAVPNAMETFTLQ